MAPPGIVSGTQINPIPNGNFAGHGDDDAACLHAMQYVNASLSSMAVNTAVELGIFEIIASAGPDAQISASEIVSQLPKKNPNTASGLDRMLRLLVTHSFLTCSLRTLEDGSVERIYGLAPATKFLTKNENEGSLASMIALANHKAVLDIWSHMKDVLIEGGDQFKKRNGVSMFELMHTDPTFNKIYNGAMAGISALIMTKILNVYKGFEGLKSLADVGGGKGQILSMVVSKYPSIKGLNFDLPHVIHDAPSYPGIEHVEGDMFVSVPKADAIILKDVLHNWSDEDCKKVLKNCYEALTENGKIVIITMIPPEVPDSSLPCRYLAGIDYIMLLQYSGRERSEKELEALCKGSGFSKFQVAYLAYGAWSVVEFYKQ